MTQPDQLLTLSQQQVVLDFINERPEYVRALRLSVAADDTYRQCEGQAAARRDLATRLGMTTPSRPGDLAMPAVTAATLVQIPNAQPRLRVVDGGGQ